MFCRFCGTKLNDYAKFCPQCGKPVQSNEVKEKPQGLGTVGNASIFNLCAQFPTEAQRYNAYRWLCIITVVIAGIYQVLEAQYRASVWTSVPFFEPVPEPSVFLGIFSLLAGIVGIVSIYVALYIWWKSGIVKYVCCMILGLIVSIIIYITLGKIFTGLAIIGVIVSIIANYRRWHYLAHYKRYIAYTLGPVIIEVIAIIVGMVSFVAALFVDSSLIMLALIAMFVVVVLPFATTLYILYAEEKRGTPFLQMCRLLFTVPITLVMLIFGLTMILPVHIFSGDALMGDFNFDANPDSIPDVMAQDVPGNPDTPLPPTVTHVDVAPVHTVESTPDLGGTTSPHVPDTTVKADTIPGNSSTDLQDTPFAPVGETLVGITTGQHFAADPNILTQTATEMGGSVALQDPSGASLVQLDNGKLLGPDHSVLGTYEHNLTLNRTDFFDASHRLLFSTDAQGNYYDANEFPMAQMLNSNGITTVVDMQQNVLYKSFNGTVFDGENNIIGAIKKI